jgi:hypothetical protein
MKMANDFCVLMLLGGVNRMSITIEPVSVSEKETLRNLLEKYYYEFSQYEEYFCTRNPCNYLYYPFLIAG